MTGIVTSEASSVMDTSNVKMRWVFAAVLGVFPVIGLICSIVYHDLSMLWASLMGAAIAAVIFPIGFVLLFIIGQFSSMCIVGLLILLSELLRFRKR